MKNITNIVAKKMEDGTTSIELLNDDGIVASENIGNVEYKEMTADEKEVQKLKREIGQRLIVEIENWAGCHLV